MATLNTDQFVDPMLSDLEGAGAGERKRINDSAQATLGGLIGNLFSTGLGTSSLIGSFTLGNEDRHQQALLDLSDKLIGQRISARQAGDSLGVQKYGIDTNAETAAASNATQQMGIATNAQTAAASLAEQSREYNMNYGLQTRNLGNQAFGLGVGGTLNAAAPANKQMAYMASSQPHTQGSWISV